MTQTQTPYRVKDVFLETCNCDSDATATLAGFQIMDHARL